MNQRLTLLLAALLLSVVAFAQETVVITDADLVAGETYNWTSDNVYQLDGYVFLEDGGTLNIEAGTRIEGLADPSSSNDLASALIITRGAQIFANGTADEPIVFTAEGQDDTFSVPAERGSWGGVIVLGNASVGDENGLGTANVEGIPIQDRTIYGGGDANDDTESSGSLTYVSVLFAGATLADNNEINGLTLGGVGSGTRIEYIEIFGNSDDGIEIFGGSVDIKYALVAYCGDDSFDTDQGWSGRGQFWVTMQLPNDQSGNNQNGGEHDGSENPSEFGPVQTVWNATYIGMGTDGDNGENNTGLRIRNQAAISYNNSIFTEFGEDGLRLQDTSQNRYVGDEFQLQNNIFWNFGNGNEFSDFVRVDNDDLADTIVAKLIAEGNLAVDPMLGRVTFEASEDGGADGNGVDPRPMAGSPALSGGATPPTTDTFYTATAYRGAFGPSEDYWVDWTYTYDRGYLIELSTSTVDFGRNNGLVLEVPAPNPASSLTTLSIELPTASTVDLTIYDQTGRLVEQTSLGRRPAGVNKYTLEVSSYPSGHYFVVMRTDAGAVAQRFVVSR